MILEKKGADLVSQLMNMVLYLTWSNDFFFSVNRP